MVEKNITLSEFYNADEVFTTGKMGELTPVVEIDGRLIENLNNSEERIEIYNVFKNLTKENGETL